MKLLIKKMSVLCVVLLSMMACSKMTKQEYLESYEQFIGKVSANASTLSEQEWRTYDKDFEKYNVELREQFTNEFTWKDELVLARLGLKYNVLRSSNFIKEQISDVFSDVNTVKKQVEEYVEKGMQKDLDVLIKESKKIGGDIEKTVNDTLKDLEKSTH